LRFPVRVSADRRAVVSTASQPEQQQAGLRKQQSTQRQILPKEQMPEQMLRPH